MQNKKSLLSYTIYIFAFIYSGTIIYSPYYTGGNPVFNYLVSSGVGVLYALLLKRLFSGRARKQKNCVSKMFSLPITFFAIISASFVVGKYISSLAGFADYYAKPVITLFATATILTCSVLCARKGRISVLGFAGLVFSLFVVWTLSGFFAFFTTKNIVVPDLSIFDVSGGLGYAVKSAVYICLDITFAGAVLCSGQSEKCVVCDALPKGTAWFVLLSGINLVKSLLVFGKEFALSISNPDLAALRLVPMFDLPEISVIVNTFACIVKLSGYCYLIFFVMKRAFAKNDCQPKEAQ